MSLSYQTMRFALVLSLILAFTILLSNCSGEPIGGGPGAGPNSSSSGVTRLQGAGATFPNPLYQKWLSEYGKINATSQIDYQSVGSGAGIKQIQEQTIDFGATDKPMSDEELKKAPGEIIHVPTVLGAVVITYNLPGVTEPLNFSSDVLADIFLGKITKWDDPRIKADNPGVNLPANTITVVHRSDGSGTSAVFTDFLSKVSPEWKEKVGTGTSLNWPVGQGGKGNEGVTGQIKSQPNTIGYVELAFAEQNKLPVARIKNQVGQFVAPTLDAVTAAAAESSATTPEDMRVSITNATGAAAYPIASYTYILLYKDQRDPAKAKALVDFLWWGIHNGGDYARALQYAPLPPEVVARAEAKLNAITAGGKPIRQ